MEETITVELPDSSYRAMYYLHVFSDVDQLKWVLADNVGVLIDEGNADNREQVLAAAKFRASVEFARVLREKLIVGVLS